MRRSFLNTTNVKPRRSGFILWATVILILQPQAINAAEPFEKLEQIAQSITVHIQGWSHAGSGIIIHRQGNSYTVLTAAHVVDDVDESYTIITDGSETARVPPEKIQHLPGLDLALLSFTSSDTYPVAKLGNSIKLKPGQPCYIFGFPSNIGQFNQGHVTANLHQELDNGISLACSTLTSKGMSGGPIMNHQGKVIGVLAERYTPDKRSVDSFVSAGVPINTFLKNISQTNIQLSLPQPKSTSAQPPKTSEEFLLIGLNKSTQRNYKGAIAHFNQSIAIAPHRAYSFNARGDAFKDLKQDQKAIEDYDQAILLAPSYSFAYSNRGDSYKNLGNYRQAIADHHKAIALQPSNAFYISRLGQVYEAMEDYTKALAEYNRAIIVEPENSFTYLFRGHVHQRIGNDKRAIADYTKAIELSPQYDFAYARRADIHKKNHNYPQAILDYSQAIEKAPQYPWSYSQRAEIYVEQKQYSKAIKDYSQALLLEPQNITFLTKRGDIYARLGNYSRAIADYDKVILVEPSSAFYIGRRGDLHLLQQNYPKAITDYTQAMRLNPQSHLNYMLRGNAYLRLGNVSQARRDWRIALDLAMKNGDLKSVQSIRKLLDLAQQ